MRSFVDRKSCVSTPADILVINHFDMTIISVFTVKLWYSKCIFKLKVVFFIMIIRQEKYKRKLKY